MLVYLFKYIHLQLRQVFFYYYHAKERKAIENERKLDEYLRFLRRDRVDKESVPASRNLLAESNPPVEYNCVKKEGEEMNQLQSI